MISNSYSSARMWALTKRYAVENRRNILITLGVMFGIILLVSILVSKAFGSGSESDGPERSVVLWAFYAWMSALIVQIAGSLTFSSMTSKSKRIANLMIPAGQGEKFISQCLLYVVGGNTALILSLLLADSLSALVFGFQPGWLYLYDNIGVAQMVDEIPYGWNFVAVTVLAALWLYLFGQAIYVLGSAWWPRKSFLKTFVAILALQIIVPIVMPWGALSQAAVYFVKWFDVHEFSPLMGWTMVWCAVTVAYALLAGVYCLAWQRYRRLEIVKRFLN